MIFLPKMAPAAAILAVAMLAGCAGSDIAFPSLAPRAVEKLPIEDPVSDSTGPVAVPADAATAAAIRAQLAAAETARGRFDGELADARRAVAAAAGQPAESEAWIAAQQAISRLDQERGPVTSALASLDEMVVATGGAPSPELTDAWSRVSAIDEAQRRAFGEVAGKLPNP